MEVIRSGVEADLDALNDLYNHYVVHTAATFDLDPVTMDDRRAWFARYATTGRHRLFVAAGDDGVLGYVTSSPFRPKRAYETSVETTVYLRPDAVGRGLGRCLYGALFAALAGEDLHRAYAGVTQPNPASVTLHRALGFHHVGTFAEQGRKFGRYWDVAWYERPLGPGAAPSPEAGRGG